MIDEIFPNYAGAEDEIGDVAWSGRGGGGEGRVDRVREMARRTVFWK